MNKLYPTKNNRSVVYGYLRYNSIANIRGYYTLVIMPKFKFDPLSVALYLINLLIIQSKPLEAATNLRLDY